MFIYLSILLLLLSPLAMLILRLARPNFVYHWLIAVAGALVAWPMLIVAGLRLPQTLTLVTWQIGTVFSSAVNLSLDQFSWPYALGLTSLVLAVILTDVARAAEADWANWAGSLFLTALGLLAVMAGNPLTLLLAWTAIDLFELFVLLGVVFPSVVRERIVIAFSARVLGSVLLIAAGMVAWSDNETLTYAISSPPAILLMILAAGLRLGVFPLHLPFLQEPPLRRGLGTVTRLMPTVTALVLLARMASALEQAGVKVLLAPILLGLAGLAALYAGASWLTAANELEGRPKWILGMASIVMASTIRAQPAASLAWGVATVFSGGILFLSSLRDRRLSWLLLLGLAGISALPFMPAWNGARLFHAPFDPILLLFFIALVLLMLGYYRHTLRPGDRLAGVERWVWVIYPVGLALLPATHFAIGWLTKPTLADVSLSQWLIGPIMVALLIAGIIWGQRVIMVPKFIGDILDYVFSFRWLFFLFGMFFRWFERLVSFLTTVLEGEGGLLWILLWIVLLLSFLATRRGG
ncbi:MAG: hypothetical protein A2Z45_03950 [Chloroflexi bacterium RBG_19FT_COMBO_55_16]|nr:MAG: hypothetical protein A2Z45_03950 [Chloroflexi bacterium RBG_19FT_COMBO_55_16]